MGAMERKSPGYVNTWNIFKRFWPVLLAAVAVLALLIGWQMTHPSPEPASKRD